MEGLGRWRKASGGEEKGAEGDSGVVEMRRKGTKGDPEVVGRRGKGVESDPDVVGRRGKGDRG